MVLGTQWYILFNVIAGASILPRELKDVAKNFQLKGWLWWRKVALPGVFPYYVTGAITASGGSWNASVVAEVATWGDKTLRAHGLGAYIADATAAGDFRRIVLGIATMSFFVVIVNRPARPFRFRKIHAAAPDRRPRPAAGRHAHLYGASDRWAAGRHRDGVPELRAVSVAHSAGECAAWSRGAPHPGC
jgi:ABC-type anion transport system duplicated permease subunit